MSTSVDISQPRQSSGLCMIPATAARAEMKIDDKANR